MEEKKGKNIFNGMSITEARILVHDTLRFICDASTLQFQMEEDFSIKKEKKKIMEIKFRQRNTEKLAKACVHLTYNELEDKETANITKCKAWMQSPLHSKLNEKWIAIKSIGDLIDYMILHLCPNLFLIRSLEYARQAFDTNPNDSYVVKCVQHKEENITKNTPNIYFEIYNSLTENKKITLEMKFLNQNTKDIVFFMNVDDKQIQLDSFLKYDMEMWSEMSEDKDFLEHGFAHFKDIKKHCPHPCTSTNFQTIFSYIN